MANTLKSKVSELDIRSRIEPTANVILEHEYGKPTLRELAPGRRNAIQLKPGGSPQDPRYALDVLAGTWQNSGIVIPDSKSNDGNGKRAPNAFLGSGENAVNPKMGRIITTSN